MDKGIYTALSGGLAKSHELEIIANNLANANTPGFKRDTATFNEYLTDLRRTDTPDGVDREVRALTDPNARPTGDKSFVEMDGVYTDFRQGTLEQTNRPLDVGIEGKGFFEVLTPAGVRYTRSGNFSVSADGKLVTESGFPVLSRGNRQVGNAAPPPRGLTAQPAYPNNLPTNQPVPQRTPPPEAREITLGQGPVRITSDGQVIQNGQAVATISIEEFHEPQWLEKVGNSFYRNTDPRNLNNAPVRSTLHQGFLEGSNVNPVSEMTRLIEATRAYESHLQAIKTYQDVDTKTVNDIVR